MLLISLAAAACSLSRATPTPVSTAQPTTSSTQPTTSPTESVTAATEKPSPTPTNVATLSPTETSDPVSTPSPTPTVAPPLTPTPEPTPEEVQDESGEETKEPSRLIYDVFSRSLLDVAKKMRESGNTEYIPILVEIMYFPLNAQTEDYLGTTLSILSGQEGQLEPHEEQDWFFWYEWLGNHPEAQPPEGYAAWKGQLYGGFDPRIAAFFYEGVKTNIRLEGIAWGGVPKDGIPDLTNPPIISASEATYLSTSDRVFGVSINGEHRAYPLRIMNPHELANDVLGGVPIALIN